MVNTRNIYTREAFICHCQLKPRFHSLQSNKRLRRIPTSLLSCILTSHVLLCTVWKKACVSIVWLKAVHSGTLVTLSLILTRLLKLVERLLWVYWCFLTLSIKLRAFPISAVTVSLHYLPRCLRSTATCSKTPATVTWSKTLKICSHVIVTRQRPTVEQSARKLRNLLLPGKEQTQALITALHRTVNLAHVQRECLISK